MVDFAQADVPSARITPNLTIADPQAAYWFKQATLRLRREVAWCWQQRTPFPDPLTGALPPVTDAAAENLDLIRYENQKGYFFNNDPAARYLSDQIAQLTAEEDPAGCRTWPSDIPAFTDAGRFVLALGLAARYDSAIGPVIATCLNDQNRPYPTLALAQRLWDDPGEIVPCGDPDHPLFRYGLLASINDAAAGQVWQQPLDMPAVIARQLADPESNLPQGMTLLGGLEVRNLDSSGEFLLAHLQADRGTGMRIVPLLGPPQAAFADWAYTLGRHLHRPVVQVDDRLLADPRDLLATAGVCRLRGLDLLVSDQWVQTDTLAARIELLLSAQSIPVRWYVPVTDQSQLRSFPTSAVTPPLKIAGLSFEQRLHRLQQGLGGQAGKLTTAVEECARRFRFQEQTICRVTRLFNNKKIPLSAEALAGACANEARVELDNLAQQVTPRFTPKELILPDEQAGQFNEIVHAMQALTVVHYHWGTARVWNECGIAVLFCGTPGTGKTMAAEALSRALNIPMFRIDLSQVVNKYIGETEKNLKKIFDAAELSDCILFFDEADALFGKRTEVKDAHDRFANVEISYLLERMERFKGLAILATNRRKDLDDAFIRRLRFVIEFPIPGVAERLQIWRLVFPAGVDVSDIDFKYLAKQFQLSGGHIRSIAFNACLRAADTTKESSGSGKVMMVDLLLAVKRELEKMNRTADVEQFGLYSNLLRERAG